MGWMAEVLDRAKSPVAMVGLVGQAIFFMRFFLQWIASERAQRSVIPQAFWYCSIGGGMLLLLYGVLDRDPVILIGQSTGLAIYLRNIVFLRREGRAAPELG